MLCSLAALLAAGSRISGRWHLTPILSGSMAPDIPRGSLVLVERTSAESIRKGDVVIFRIPIGDHHLSAHRVVKIVERGTHPIVQTKGDANSTVDPWNARLDGSTASKVRLAVPFLGYAALVARGRWGALLLACAVGLFPAAMVYRRVRLRPAQPEGSGHATAAR